MKSSKRSGELDKVGLSFAKLMQVLGEEKSPLPGSDSGVPDGWRSILNDLKQERDDHLLGSDFSQTSLETEKDFGAMLSDLENHGLEQASTALRKRLPQDQIDGSERAQDFLYESLGVSRRVIPVLLHQIFRSMFTVMTFLVYTRVRGQRRVAMSPEVSADCLDRTQQRLEETEKFHEFSSATT